MRKTGIILAVLLQIVVLLVMAGEREYIMRYGKTIYLRTAPIDPRDLFRGDYVRLSYEISAIPAVKFQDKMKTPEIKKGQKIYAVLKEGPNNLYELDYADTEKPAYGLYIIGRLRYHHQFSKSRNPIPVKYSLEAYFVQQGKGLDIEQRRGGRNEIQIPLEMEIAVASNGRAVIKGHRWSPLGMGLKILESSPRNDPHGRRSAKISLALKNVSDSPLALVKLPNQCSFSLEPINHNHTNWVPDNATCDTLAPVEEDIIVLAPDREQAFVFDFSEQRWWVKKNNTPVEIGTLNMWERFRLVYRPPDESQCLHVNEKDLIWHGYLPSRAFHGVGNID